MQLGGEEYSLCRELWGGGRTLIIARIYIFWLQLFCFSGSHTVYKHYETQISMEFYAAQKLGPDALTISTGGGLMNCK